MDGLPRKPKIIGTCETCGETFETFQSSRRFCGNLKEKRGCVYKRTLGLKRKKKAPEIRAKEPDFIPDYENETITRKEEL